MLYRSLDIDLQRNGEPATVVFSITDPHSDPATDQFRCEYLVRGISGAEFPRIVLGSDSMGAIEKALEAITILANCLLGQFDSPEPSNPRVGALGFRIIPDLQMAIRLYRRGQFVDALPYLMLFVESNVAELQLLVGSALYLARSSDSVIGRSAFRWCEMAAEQGLGQAYAYMTEVCRRFPIEFADEGRNIERYIEQSRALGFIAPGICEN